ncbi:MAG: hypothetical protein MZV63_40985 [Marinilabiliales bacterium]|nr:hypothetical protein [Marinilabiliales bacterium]
MKRNYMAVYHANLNKVIQLATPDMPEIQLADKGDGTKAVASVKPALRAAVYVGEQP